MRGGRWLASSVAAVVIVGLVPVTGQAAQSTMAFGLASPTIEQLRVAESRLGQEAAVVGLYTDFTRDFPRADVDAVHDGAAAALISWEPWDWAAGGALDQPEYALARIADGAHDEHIAAWLAEAQQATERGRVLVRFAPEMNGDWNPWSTGVNGNGVGDYVRAWRHVHDVAGSAGAVDIEWVWNPVVSYAGSTPLAALYPGDAYLDLVGLDGYNWGTTRSWSRWQSFDEVFAPTVRQIRTLAPGKPWGVAETATTLAGGDKAAWTRDALARARALGATFLVWFDFDKETDWRLTHDAAVVRAARSALSR